MCEREREREIVSVVREREREREIVSVCVREECVVREIVSVL